MKKLFASNANLAIVASLFFLMIIGCQPAGGNLLPVADGQATVITTTFENDTIQLVEDGLTFKFLGEWTGNGYIQLRLDVKNDASKDAKINFGDFKLENGKQKRQNAGVVNDKINNSTVTDKNAAVVAGERRVFGVEFSSPFGGSLPEDQTEQMLYFTLPIEIDGTPKISREIKVVFRAVENR